jgi:NADP-dependent 3-hydroxy acid dehydrogenase YdfG
MTNARFEPHPDRRPAMVTGASSGIGRAVAMALAGSGHPVVLGARRLERLEEIATEIRDTGGEAYTIRVDLRDPASIDAFCKTALEALGWIDVLVSCAGHNLPDSALEPPPDTDLFARTLEVNLLAAHRLVSMLLADMVSRRHGDLVFVTSEVVRSPRVRDAAYVASKWGLEGYVRTLQMELEGTGVRASIVRPGQTLSEMGSDWDPDVTAEVLDEWVRWGVARHDHFLRPDAVAAAVGAVIGMPPGAHMTLVEVQPEAPVLGEPGTRGGKVSGRITSSAQSTDRGGAETPSDAAARDPARGGGRRRGRARREPSGGGR